MKENGGAHASELVGTTVVIPIQPGCAPPIRLMKEVSMEESGICIACGEEAKVVLANAPLCQECFKEIIGEECFKEIIGENSEENGNS
ncbi:hypothetical protein [Thermus albus]|uniref:hypothetical protein n=1 Tax=Thermus albus TaxID=2908146 RepID=UPI001FAA15DE|nr:hypothetical protein [Thermus albus]